MPKNIYVVLQMMYVKYQEQGNICHFFTIENRNLDSEIAKI